MVVRNGSWKPKAGDVISHTIQQHGLRKGAAPALAEDDRAAVLAESVPMGILPNTDSMLDKSHICVYDAPWTTSDGLVESALGRQIHGFCKLPEGYAITIVPRDATRKPLRRRQRHLPR